MLLPTAEVQRQTHSSSDDRIAFQMIEISILLWESLENMATGTRGSELGSGCFKQGPWEAMVGPDSTAGASSSTGPCSSSSVTATTESFARGLAFFQFTQQHNSPSQQFPVSAGGDTDRQRQMFPRLPALK